MQYNTEKDHLIIPEYGRHVQQMVDYAITVEDKEKRQKVAQAIIEVIGNLNPHLRDVPDFKHKLWDHLFLMSDFKLDVESPYPMPTKETFEEKPKTLEYPQKNIKYRYYGKTIMNMIDAVVGLEEDENRPQLIKALANHMKKSYLNWNKDSVEDQVILNHLEELSNGKLKLQEEQSLTSTQTLVQKGGIQSEAPLKKRPVKKRNFKRRK